MLVINNDKFMPFYYTHNSQGIFMCNRYICKWKDTNVAVADIARAGGWQNKVTNW